MKYKKTASVTLYVTLTNLRRLDCIWVSDLKILLVVWHVIGMVLLIRVFQKFLLRIVRGWVNLVFAHSSPGS